MCSRPPCRPRAARHLHPIASQVKVALVTRNTTQSVDAFFGLIGDEWRPLFSDIRTREFRYVKPDKRLLLDLAEV